MSESNGKSSDIKVPPLAPINSEVAPQSVSQTSANNLQDILVRLVDRLDKMEASVANVSSANLLLQERLTAQEQDRISLHPSASEFSGELAGGEYQPSVEELDTCNQDSSKTSCQAEESAEAQSEVMSTSKCSIVAGLFKQKTSRNEKQLTVILTSTPFVSIKRKREETNDLKFGNEVIKEIVITKDKESPQVCGPPILENLASAVTKFWKTEAKSDLVIKKLKGNYAVASNCPKLFVQTLNEEIMKNKNINPYYKRNDKRWFDLQNLILKSTAIVTDIANNCLEAENRNEIIHSKDIVVKAIDAITLLGRANYQFIFERKERLKNALSDDYKAICEQDHSDSKQLLGDDLAENIKKAKSTYYLNQSISNKRLKPSSSPRNPTSLSNHTKSSQSLNSQGRKKNFTSSQVSGTSNRWSHQPKPRGKRN